MYIAHIVLFYCASDDTGTLGQRIVNLTELSRSNSLVPFPQFIPGGVGTKTFRLLINCVSQRYRPPGLVVYGCSLASYTTCVVFIWAVAL